FGLNDIPYEDLTFPTPNGKIQIQDSIIELYNREPSQDRGQNEFFLLSPGHKYFIHSQMGEINKKFKEVFKKIYLNPSDIKSIGLKAKDEVFVSNKFCKGKFLLEQNHALKPGTALIYSGLPFANMLYKNANYFTSETPEESKLSGAYFSTIVKVSRA
ncbi:MAG: molybdopterin dinucleotide binding domain-containing protein, partial [Candidatus Hermodarchaeota archaeon]